MSRPEEALDFVRDGGEGTLSMKALVELLKAVLGSGKPFRVRATGFSMSPFIQNYDTITISPLPPGGPCIGDIAAFIQPKTGKLVVHRVVGMKKDGYLMRGDNAQEPDGLIPASCILGYITRVEREGKPVSLRSRPEKVLIALLSHRGLLLPSLILMHRLLRPIIRRFRT